jgi:hypothetical protein
VTQNGSTTRSRECVACGRSFPRYARFPSDRHSAVDTDAPYEISRLAQRPQPGREVQRGAGRNGLGKSGQRSAYASGPHWKQPDPSPPFAPDGMQPESRQSKAERYNGRLGN